MSATPPPAAPGAGLSTTAIAAIATGIGVSLICIIALVALLVRAVQNHRQLLADLEERGVSFAHVQGQARDSVTRPRTVLRRNSVLPFNSNSGWGTLTSVETFKSAESPAVVAHYVPPKPSDATKKASRLSWPFHTRRVSGHNIHLKRVKGSRLSTVLEDPKPSALVPVLSSHHNVSRPSLAASSHRLSRSTSSQSLLQYHPAFRASSEVESRELGSPVSTNSFFRTGANDRLQRAKSFADVPTEPLERPPLRARSASLSSHTSGRAPDVILPPLPLDIARIKSETKRQSQLRRIPSKQSESSFETADTSILGGHASPVVPQTAKRRPQKITKPRTRGSGVAGSRYRDSLDLRAKVLSLRRTPSSSPTRASLISADIEEPSSDRKSITWDTPSPHAAGSVPMLRPSLVRRSSSPTPNPRAGPATPKRKLASQSFSEGSPEKQKRSTTPARGYSGVVRSPKRQHSQTSSRSSGGNPFQWDPAPFSPTGKPSALKGSPSARQGHRRKNSVRISLVPIFHGPPTSPSFPSESKDDTIEGASSENLVTGLGLAVPDTRPLPTPPSSSIFAPELKFPTTSLRASLTSTSPALPLIGYDQAYVVFPTDQVMNELSTIDNTNPSEEHGRRLSEVSQAPPCDLGNQGITNDLSTPIIRTYNSNRDFQMPPTPYLYQYPFRPETPEEEQSRSCSDFTDYDSYDPDRPAMLFQTPISNASRPWQSAFATIPEESSVSSKKTVDLDREHHDDSPPVSPKTASPPRFNLTDRSVYNIPVYATTIPEEMPDTIDPAILDKDTFKSLNNTIKAVEQDFISLPNSKRSSLALVIPPTSKLAHISFEPLLEAAFPTDTPKHNDSESPVLGHVRSDASSIYSLPSPLPELSPTSSPIELPSPVMPCSPRPAYAQLPGAPPRVAIDFFDMPKLSPSLHGPRRSPPKPLRTSIAALRRMNSDAAKAKKEKAGRGERRYLRFGREDSVALPGEESWLDDLEDDVSTVTSEVDGEGIAVSTLSDWDEGRTILDLEEGSSTLDSLSTITPDTELQAPSFNPDIRDDTVAGAQQRESSIWEDGEKFWASPTPSRPNSTQKGNDNRQSFIVSPPPPSTSSTIKQKASKKRDFEVAKDSSPTPATPTKHRARGRDRKKRRESVEEAAMAGASSRRYMKRNALGLGTPYVKIQVTSPSGRIVARTPGSLYDSQGFLRYDDMM